MSVVNLVIALVIYALFTVVYLIMFDHSVRRMRDGEHIDTIDICLFLCASIMLPWVVLWMIAKWINRGERDDETEEAGKEE